MNQRIKYLAYEELKVEKNLEKPGSFQLLTPWVKSEISVEIGSPIEKVLQKFSIDGICSAPKELLTLSNFFSQIPSLPIFYALPRQGIDFGTDRNVSSKLPRFFSPSMFFSNFTIPTLSSSTNEWSWDFDAALELSTCAPEKLDPISLLSIVRRFHYLDLQENKIQEVHDRIEKMGDPKKKDAALALVVRQNHYVTVKCESSLLPALNNAQSCKSLLEKFISDEHGHDLLLGSSLANLGCNDPSTLSLTNSVVALMEVLQKSAEVSFLGFCFALEFFEKPQFRETDVWADLIESSGKASSARALQQHKDINDGGSHESIALSFIEKCKPVDIETAEMAFRFAELCSKSIAGVGSDLIQMMDAI